MQSRTLIALIAGFAAGVAVDRMLHHSSPQPAPIIIEIPEIIVPPEPEEPPDDRPGIREVNRNPHIFGRREIF